MTPAKMTSSEERTDSGEGETDAAAKVKGSATPRGGL